MNETQIHYFMNWKETLQLVVAATLPALAKLVFMVLVGALLNWIFLLIFGNQFWTVLMANKPSFGAKLPGILFFVLFVFGFPVFYFLVGKSYAIKATLQHIYQKKAPAIFEYFVPKVVELAGTTVVNNQTVASIKNLHGNFVAKIPNMPWLLRLLYAYLVQKIPFKTTLDEIAEKTPLTEENYSSISQQLSQKLSSHIENELLGVSFKNFFLLLIVNVIIMVVVVKIIL